VNKEKIVNGFRIIHTTPEVSAEQNEDIKKDIIRKLYSILSNDDKTLDTKVKN